MTGGRPNRDVAFRRHHVSSNPLLNQKYFEPETAAGAPGAPVPPAWDQTASPWPPAEARVQGRTMSIGGVASATGVMFIFLLAAGWFGWGRVVETFAVNDAGQRVATTTFPTGWVLGSILVGFALVIACSFKPPLARFLAIPYSIAQGVALGAISHVYDFQSRGIALQAVLATAGVFLAMLVLYGLRILRATPKLVKGVVAATFGIMAMYAVGMIASLFGADLRFWESTSLLSIGISLLIVGVAAFNLILDFDFIERGSKEGLPANMDWFAALGLVVTLVWLYLEMLRLLSKLQRR